MNLHRLSLAAAIVSSLSVAAGCASDPNKKVESAEANLTSAHEQANADQADLSRKQAEDRSDHANAGWEKNAEMQRKHESEQAETTANSQQNITGAQAGVVDAHVDMIQDRKDFDFKVQERLTKADAKAQELKTKSVKLNGKKATDFNSNYKLYTQARTDAETKARSLSNTDRSVWSNAKSDVEKRLDLMESSLDKVGKDL